MPCPQNHFHQREWVVFFVYAHVLKVHKDRNDTILSESRDQAQVSLGPDYLSPLFKPCLNGKYSAFQFAANTARLGPWIVPFLPCLRSLITEREYRVNMHSLG